LAHLVGDKLEGMTYQMMGLNSMGEQ
jgi:hypothetical protein